MGEGAWHDAGKKGKIDRLGKDTQPSKHPPHQAKAGEDYAGGRADIPPRRPTWLLPTCAFQLALLMALSSKRAKPIRASCSVVPNSSLGGGEQLGVCC